MNWWDQMSSIFVFWMLSFKPTFSSLSLSSRGSLILLHFLPSEWCHLHIWGDWYFSWQSWFQMCFIQSSMSHDVLWILLKKQVDNIQPWRTPFQIWKQSVVPCPVLTFASWPAHRFPRRQVRWSVRVSGPKFGLVTRIRSIVFLKSDQSPLKYQYKCSWSAEAQNPSGKHSPI